MADIFEYAEEYRDIMFGDEELNEIDNAIFCRLAYLDFSGFAGKTLGEIAEKYTPAETENKQIKETERLLTLIGNTKRFGYTSLCATNEIISEDSANAFYGETFALDKDTYFIAFRGTDDKFVSYYEDAELAYAFPIASQTTAFNYVSSELKSRSGEFYIGGHSKGGNLALFSYIFLSDAEKSRIVKVFNNDGPGFPEEMAEILFTPFNNRKILSILPEDSIVGRMLDIGGEIKIIKSTAYGAAQHNIFTWETEGSSFVSAGQFSLMSEYVEDTLTDSLKTINPKHIKSVAQMILGISRGSGIRSTKEIDAKGFIRILISLRQIYKENESSDEDIQIIIKTLIKSLFGAINLEKMINRSMPAFTQQLEALIEKYGKDEDKENASEN